MSYHTLTYHILLLVVFLVYYRTVFKSQRSRNQSGMERSVVDDWQRNLEGGGGGGGFRLGVGVSHWLVPHQRGV